MKPRKFDKGERPFNKFRSDAPKERGERNERPAFQGGSRGFPRPSRPSFGDDDFTYVASGEVAEMVGSRPMDRREMQRRIWDYYLDQGLVKRAPGARPPRREFESRPPRGDDERPRSYQRRDDGDRPPRSFAPRSDDRRGGGDRPRSFSPRAEGDRPRSARPRTEGERPRTYGPRAEGDRPRSYGPRSDDAPRRSSSRPAPDGPRKYARKPEGAPRTSTRTPAGKHPTARKAEAISKVPRRKFKETRERNEE